MIDKSMLLKQPYDVARKILKPHVSIALLHRRYVNAVNATIPARLNDAGEMLDDKAKMLKKFIVIAAIAQICGTVRIAV